MQIILAFFVSSYKAASRPCRSLHCLMYPISIISANLDLCQFIVLENLINSFFVNISESYRYKRSSSSVEEMLYLCLI